MISTKAWLLARSNEFRRSRLCALAPTGSGSSWRGARCGRAACPAPGRRPARGSRRGRGSFAV